MKTLTLIVPCYNESEVLPLLYKEVRAVAGGLAGFNVILLFVDDGSSDKTLEIIKNFTASDGNVKYVSFSRNFGKEAAMLAGMSYAGGDYVGIIDADLQHSPSMIPEMLEAVDEHGYDVAAAKRTDRAGESAVKGLLSGFFYKVMNSASDVYIDDNAQDFRIMRMNVVKAILSLPERGRFSKGIFSWVGFKTKWFPHENRERAAGTTKWSFKSLLKYAFEGILSFTTSPLKLPTYFGGLSIFAGILSAAYGIMRGLTDPKFHPGHYIILAAVCGVGGLVLLMLGIIAAYLAKLFREIKARPMFIVAETNI
ncbi:MAG: glycosyltransferase [Oscillospiraceae bacterium]|nr:glycosyltransferase [Oscillospiraceae bacterium]